MERGAGEGGEVKTNAKERAKTLSHADYGIHGDTIRDLIADVDDAAVLLGEAGLAIRTGAGTYDLAQRITDFLKEPDA